LPSSQPAIPSIIRASVIGKRRFIVQSSIHRMVGLTAHPMPRAYMFVIDGHQRSETTKRLLHEPSGLNRVNDRHGLRRQALSEMPISCF
jgi:hypothetical protein